MRRKVRNCVLTFRRLPYLRRRETPRSTVKTVSETRLGTGADGLTELVATEWCQNYGVKMSLGMLYPTRFGYEPSSPSLYVLGFG